MINVDWVIVIRINRDHLGIFSVARKNDYFSHFTGLNVGSRCAILLSELGALLGGISSTYM